MIPWVRALLGLLGYRRESCAEDSGSVLAWVPKGQRFETDIKVNCQLCGTSHTLHLSINVEDLS